MKETAGSDAEDEDNVDDENDWAAWEVDSNSDSDSSDAADGWVDVSSDEEHALEISDSEDEKNAKKKGKKDEESEDEDEDEESKDDGNGKKDAEGMEVDTPEVPADLLQSLAATKVYCLLCRLLMPSHNDSYSLYRSSHPPTLPFSTTCAPKQQQAAPQSASAPNHLP